MIKRAYLAGKMTGMPEMNFPAFRAAAVDLRAKGWSIFNPAENCGDQSKTREEYITMDIRAIVGGEHFDKMDAVVVLPGWEQSRGARLEVETALQCGVEVLWAYTLQPVTRLQFEMARLMTHDDYLLPQYEGVPA